MIPHSVVISNVFVGIFSNQISEEKNIGLEYDFTFVELDIFFILSLSLSLQCLSVISLFRFIAGAAAKEAWLKIRNCHRDALRRQKKSKCTNGSRAVVIKQWKYQQQMDFLVSYMIKRKKFKCPLY